MMRDSDDRPVAATLDPEGRPVVLLERIWFGKIAIDHPEVLPLLDALIETVHAPDVSTGDPMARRVRYYARDIGPSRWLRVVVSYEQVPARIITVHALRKVEFEHEY